MATRIPVIIDQGTTFETTIDLTDQDGEALVTSGYSARAQMRRHYASTNSVAFTCDLSNGSLILSLTSEQTSNLEAGRYVYDVELEDASNNIIRLIEGIVTLTPQVTR